jgi:hypothetical protein
MREAFHFKVTLIVEMAFLFFTILTPSLSEEVSLICKYISSQDVTTSTTPVVSTETTTTTSTTTTTTTTTTYISITTIEIESEASWSKMPSSKENSSIRTLDSELKQKVVIVNVNSDILLGFVIPLSILFLILFTAATLYISYRFLY